MKRILVATLLFTIAAIPLFAQHYVNWVDHNPVHGDSVDRHWLQIDNFQPGPSGQGAVFDFRSAVRRDTVEHGRYLTQLGPGPWNYQLRLDLTGPAWTTSHFSQSTPDSLSWSGYEHTSATEYRLQRRIDPSVALYFPTSYPSSYADYFSGDLYFLNMTFPTTGVVHVTCDAEGILLLENDTIPDVLRIHTIDSLAIHLDFNHVWLVKECWDYYSAWHRFPIVSRCDTPGVANSDYTWTSLHPGETVVSADPALADAVHMGPNPFGQTLRVRGAGGTWALLDAQGRVLRTGKLQHGTTELGVADLPVGMYTLQVQQGHRAVTRRVVKVE